MAAPLTVVWAYRRTGKFALAAQGLAYGQWEPQERTAAELAAQRAQP